MHVMCILIENSIFGRDRCWRGGVRLCTSCDVAALSGAHSASVDAGADADVMQVQIKTQIMITRTPFTAILSELIP
jgi:hypothetical protein